jgi:hypothetical protein
MSERVGVTYQVQPQPWDESCTHWVPAGPLRIGVEWRDVDPRALLATYGEGTADMAEIVEKSPAGGFYDKGVSLHICSVEPAHEYLRFDVFDDDPHYHYVDTSGQSNRVVAFDEVAHGDMLPWALDRLRRNLPPMLRAAGGDDVAAQVEALTPSELESAVDAVAELAAEARRSQRT